MLRRLCFGPFTRSTSRAGTASTFPAPVPHWISTERCKHTPARTNRASTIRCSRWRPSKSASHERCLTAETLEAGSALALRSCSDSRLQRWRFLDGRLTPGGRRELCVSLAALRGEPWGTPRLITPAYRRQALALADCDDEDAVRQTFHWLPRDEAAPEPSTADRQRAGMPPEVAVALAAFGHEFDGAIAQQTAAIYATQPHVYDVRRARRHERSGVRRTRAAAARRPHACQSPHRACARDRRVSRRRAHRRQSRRDVNVAEYFASLGYVGVNGGYRLAPDAKWPEGARDIGAAVTWLRDHVAEYGGDPARIFVAGISTGALHAATYVFRPELVPPDAARPAGAILVSGPYTFDFAAAGRGELAYFGEDRVAGRTWSSRQRHERRHARAHDDGRMGQRTLYDLLRGVVPRAGRRSTASCRVTCRAWDTIIRRSCYRSAPATTASRASSSTSSSARATADVGGCTIRRVGL